MPRSKQDFQIGQEWQGIAFIDLVLHLRRLNIKVGFDEQAE
jgi:hypothetical protein